MVLARTMEVERGVPQEESLLSASFVGGSVPFVIAVSLLPKKHPQKSTSPPFVGWESPFGKWTLLFGSMLICRGVAV